MPAASKRTEGRGADAEPSLEARLADLSDRENRVVREHAALQRQFENELHDGKQLGYAEALARADQLAPQVDALAAELASIRQEKGELRPKADAEHRRAEREADRRRVHSIPGLYRACAENAEQATSLAAQLGQVLGRQVALERELAAAVGTTNAQRAMSLGAIDGRVRHSMARQFEVTVDEPGKFMEVRGWRSPPHRFFIPNGQINPAHPDAKRSFGEAERKMLATPSIPSTIATRPRPPAGSAIRPARTCTSSPGATVCSAWCRGVGRPARASRRKVTRHENPRDAGTGDTACPRHHRRRRACAAISGSLVACGGRGDRKMGAHKSVVGPHHGEFRGWPLSAHGDRHHAVFPRRASRRRAGRAGGMAASHVHSARTRSQFVAGAPPEARGQYLAYAEASPDYHQAMRDPNHPQHDALTAQTRALRGIAAAAPDAGEPASANRPATRADGARTETDRATAIHAMQRSEAYLDKRHPGHADAVAKMQALYEATTPPGAGVAPRVPAAPPPRPVPARSDPAETPHDVIERLQQDAAYRDARHPEHGARVAEMQGAYQAAYPTAAPGAAPGGAAAAPAGRPAAGGSS